MRSIYGNMWDEFILWKNTDMSWEEVSEWFEANDPFYWGA
jgi:hypothetical protein